MTTDRLIYRHRRRGLDHDWFKHEPTLQRTPIAWPGGKRLALWITVPVEFFPLDAPAQPFRPLGGLMSNYPDFWNSSGRDYGTRIGIYRIMRVLDQLGLRATAAVNAAIAERLPRLIDEIQQRNWEVMSHGVDMGHVHHGKLTENDERDWVARAHEVLTKATARPVAGWLSPGRSQSSHTLRLLVERGFEYVADWANDDLPYMMTTPAGPLCAMPLAHEWADRVLLLHHNLTVEDYEAQVLQALRQLSDEAERHGGGRILSLSVSPWILGYPHRINTLERVLTRILEAGSVWPATGMEVVAAFKSQVPH